MLCCFNIVYIKPLKKSVLFMYRLNAEKVLDPSCVAPWCLHSLHAAGGSSHYWFGIDSSAFSNLVNFNMNTAVTQVPGGVV